MPIPSSTYRVQLRPGFDFDAAAAISDYLARLGVSHLYASPYLQPAPGSRHGYDVVDPTRVNAELGGEAGHGRLCDALGRTGLGQVLDIVPNHMAITGRENRWWWDVLRNGPAGEFAPFFDVDWDPPESKLRNQVLMPILGDHYGRELEAGAIRLRRDDDGFTVRYHDHVLPVAPRSLGSVLVEAAARDEAGEHASELAFLGRALQALPEAGLVADAERAGRRADVAAVDARLRALMKADEGVREALDAVLDARNRDVDALDELLAGQNYRLAYWRTAGQELDYRRFFDIDSLAALRTEDERVFRAVHQRVLEWLDAGVLDGLRVDHPDGLRRPGEYFQRLRTAAPGAWIVAEKILMPDEALPEWPVDGTTGYDVLNDITGVFMDPAGEEPLTALWREVSGDDRSFHEVAYEARHDVLRDVLAADVNRLANIFVALCEERRRYRDYTRRELRSALAEVAACFPVYRSYVGDEGPGAERDRGAGPRDRTRIEAAVAAARRRAPDIDPELLDFLRAVLAGEIQEAEARGLRMRFQQLTGPVAAKGEEDTAFYRYNRFVALNEVGGAPGRWRIAAERFHDRMRERLASWPATMNALSTHDTKRSEDVRARLTVLAQAPEEWARRARSWLDRNADLWPEDVRRDPGSEYLLYQTLVGAWPIAEDRIRRYMEKATREAKLRTSWTEPDAEYEAALGQFISALYDGGFGAEVEEFVRGTLLAPGRVAALAQKLVHLTVPGVPDVYQGTELWDLSLVDPDNRRPVDFDRRQRLLERLGEDASPGTVLAGMDDGLPKLWVTARTLRLRGERPAAFAEGAYDPLSVEGPRAGSVLAYTRGGEVVVVVPLHPLRVDRGGGWGGTTVRLPEREWRNELTGDRVAGGVVPVGGLLERFPVALLARGST